MVKRYDCLKLLSSWLDEQTLTVTALSGVAHEWCALWNAGPRFCGLNMGMCLPFAAGLSLAFPQRKVSALEGDGSLLLDTSSLVTVAEVNPHNLVAIVFDNQSYFSREETATAHAADLEKIAQGAGIQKTVTVHTLEEFAGFVRPALTSAEFWFIVAKVEPGREPVESDYERLDGRPMKEAFVAALLRYPDYRDRLRFSSVREWQGEAQP